MSSASSAHPSAGQEAWGWGITKSWSCALPRCIKEDASCHQGRVSSDWRRETKCGWKPQMGTPAWAARASSQDVSFPQKSTLFQHFQQPNDHKMWLQHFDKLLQHVMPSFDGGIYLCCYVYFHWWDWIMQWKICVLCLSVWLVLLFYCVLHSVNQLKKKDSVLVLLLMRHQAPFQAFNTFKNNK